MRIFHKGLLLVITMLLFELVFIGTLLWYVQQVEQMIQEQNEYARVTQLLRNIDHQTKRFGFRVLFAAIHRDAAAHDECLELLNELDRNIHQTNEELKNYPKYQAATAELDENWSTMNRIFTEMIGKAFKEKTSLSAANQALLLTEIEGNASARGRKLDDIMSYYTTKSEAAFIATQGMRDNLKLVLALGVGLNIAIAVAVLFYFNKDITRRIDKVIDNSLKLASGGELMPPDRGDDEIAKLDQVFHDAAVIVRESSERERAIFENAVDIICALDGVGVVTRVNKAFENRLGYSRESVVDTSISDYLVKDDRSAFENFLNLVRTEQQMSHHTEKNMRTIDGDICHMEWSAKWDAEQQSYFCIIYDITQRKELEQAKQQFFSMVSHDLRSPLTSIRVSLGMFLSGVFGEMGEKATHRLTTMDSSVDRLIRLINDLLDSEKLDAGRMDLLLEQVQSAEIVKAAVESVQGMAESHEMQIKIVGKDITVQVDSDRVVQVLTNLLSNAIKFSPPEATIEVRTLVRDRFAEFRVIDKGKGIGLEQQEQLFQRYKQVDTHGHIEKQGTGLGLAISKAIVEAHGGSIGVDSEPGQGSQFWFRVKLSNPVTRI